MDTITASDIADFQQAVSNNPTVQQLLGVAHSRQHSMSSPADHVDVDPTPPQTGQTWIFTATVLGNRWKPADAPSTTANKLFNKENFV